MTINLTEEVAARLAHVAQQQGRDIDAVVREAIQRYLVDESITDVEPSEVAKTQETLLPEIGGVEPWT